MKMLLVFDMNVNKLFNRGLIFIVEGTGYVFTTFAIGVSEQILDRANSKQFKITVYILVSID